MKISKLTLLLTLIAVFAGSVFATAALAQSPQVFTTDLESGPNTGGQGSQGVWVTVYGSGFGTSQGTSQVTIGGAPAYRYTGWSDSKIAFQIGNSAVSGSIVVNVGGVKSNGVPFTVRAGRIFFVSPSGNDTRQGTYNRPWQTLAKALSSAQAGDVIYAMNGTSAASLTMARSGAAGTPIALVAYPGATASIGSASGTSVGVSGKTYSYWALSGLALRSATEAVNLAGGSNWRLAGNDISCPNGSGAGACVHASAGSQIKLVANNIHDSGSTTSTDVSNYASVQLSASNVEVGWNKVANTRSCRALSFYTSGANQYGLSVHDNYIHDAVCDGISFSSVDPTKGVVQAYNNIIQRVGTGPAPGGVEETYTCIRTAGSGAGSVQLLNNTLADCGARGNGDSGAIAANTPTTVSNNIISLTSSEAYITSNTSTANLSGSNDLFWGSSFIPAPFTNSLNADPQFVDAANANFSLQPTSPAIDAGMNSGVSKDYLGISRPKGSAIDMGALEFTGTKGTTNIGQLTENPTSIDFGNVTTGTSNTQSVTVSNTGNATATISQMNVTGTGFSATGLTLPLTLTPGQSASFTVTYAPQTAGNSTGSVALISNASNATSTVQLTGSAAAPVGTLSANPGSLSFGSLVVGNNATQNVTLTASTASVTLSQATVTGAGFSISGLTLPTTIAAGQSVTFAVKFAPTTTGAVSGAIALASNASNTPTSISLSGTGAAAVGTLAASPLSLSFGSVTVGNSATQNVTLTASTASVTITQATVTGTGYSVSGLTLPATIAAGQSLTFQVKFAPTTAGTMAGSLSLVSNASNSPNVSLSGTGVAASGANYTIWAASATPSQIDSADAQAVELGMKFTADVSGYITGIRYYKASANTGTHIGNLWSSTGTKLASATFTAETASGWQQVNFATPVAVTAGTTYVASYFAPTGHYSDTANYFSTAGTDNPPLHALQNGGVYAYGSSSFPSQVWSGCNYWVDVVFTTSATVPTTGTLTASPTSLGFGSVNVGSSASQNVTVTASTASVTISQANTTGAGFSVSGLTLPMTLAAGQSATFQVKFAPSTSGSVTGSLSLVSNASNTPTTITLSGTGTTSTTSHSVSLSWAASTSTGVTGYNIYRSTTSGGSYGKIASGVSGTSYTDTNVTAGTTYYYVLTSASSTGTESSYSNQATAVVPTP